MPGAEFTADARIDREWQEARCRGNPIALHDGGTVMERRSGLEDRRQQVVGNRGVEGDAAFDVVAQPDLSLDHDDGADATRRERRRSDHEILYRLGGACDALEILEEGCPRSEEH